MGTNSKIQIPHVVGIKKEKQYEDAVTICQNCKFTTIYLLEAGAFTMAMKKNKSDQKKETRSQVYQKTRQKEH